MPGHSPGIALPYDPERARRLLAQAGYGGGRGLPAVEVGTGPNHAPYVEWLAKQWQKALGVDIICETITSLAAFDHPREMYGGCWDADYPDPDNFLRVGCPSWLTGWRNESYDGLVEKARRITNHRERMKLYRRADRILVEQAPILPLGHRRWHVLAKPWVKNYPGPWKDVIIEEH
jgi:ABC-type oligopeptide transport system substrate-binding subunit